MRHEAFPPQKDAHGRIAQIIACTRCGGTDQNTITTRSKAGNEQLASFFRRRGWSVDLKKGHTCPACTKTIESQFRSAAKKHFYRAEVTMKPSDTVPTPTPTPAASSVLAMVYMMLDDAYDKAAKRYKAGWSDDRVSKETGAALNLVTTRRAQDFGPIPPPPPAPLVEIGIVANPLLIEMSDVLSTIKALQDKATNLADRVRRIAAIAANAGNHTPEAKP